MSYPVNDPQRRGLMQQFSPLVLTLDWDEPQTFRAKLIRTVALGGSERVQVMGFAIDKPVGCIALTGSKAGLVSTALLIGFTLCDEMLAPTFSLDATQALGTITLPATLFAAYLQLVASPTVHFCIGGDGRRNAVTNDPYFLKDLEP